MPKDLPSDDSLVPISEAAEILGVSIATVRRWDKKGILHAQRPNGRYRYFSRQELERLKLDQPLTISEASQRIGISVSTLRRLEKRGIIKPERNAQGERLYTHTCLEDYLNSEHFLRQKKIQAEILAPLELREKSSSPAKTKEAEDSIEILGTVLAQNQEILLQNSKSIDRLLVLRSLLYASGGLLVTTFVLVVSFLTVLFLLFPEDAGRFFGYNLPSYLQQQATSAPPARVLGVQDGTKVSLPLSAARRVLKPFTRFSLPLVKLLNKEAYNLAVTVQPIKDINEVLTLDTQGKLAPLAGLRLFSSGHLEIPDSGLIPNLNADYLQGRQPGTGPGDLVFLNEEGNLAIPGVTLEAGPVSATTLPDGSITREKLADDVLLELNPAPVSIVSLDIKDGGVAAVDLADGAVTINKLGSDAVNSAKISDGSIEAGDIAADAIISSLIKDGDITAADLADSIITSSKISDGTVSAADIATGAITSALLTDDTVAALDLAATLTFADGDFLNLAAIAHDDTGLQGLRLPNAASDTPSSPVSGEGYIAWDAAGDQIIMYDGTNWAPLSGGSGSGDITAVGNCTSGACFNGSSGTTLTFNDAEGDGALAIADLTAARSYTLPDASGTLLLSGHTLTGDVTATLGTGGTTALTIASNAVALGTDTTENYVASIADVGNSTITVTGSGSETAAVTLNVVDVNCTDCLGATEIADIYLLNTGDTSTGALTIDGSADAIQLTVQGNVTQTSNLLTLEQSDGTDVFTVTNAGNALVAGTFAVNGNTTIGNANTDTLTINAGTSGTGITLADSSFATCTALETVSGVLTCGTDGGSTENLDTAYNAGGTITVDAYDVLFDLNDATNDYGLVIDNNTAGAIAIGLEFTSGGGGALTTAIDASATAIGTALAIGANDITTSGATLSAAELNVLDSGIALSELTDSGTLTATTVDINGGAIDGTTIGATSASTGAFTTLSSTGNTTIGNASSDTLTINAGSSGTGVAFGDASFATCTALETVGGVLTCGTDDTAAGGSGTLQEAYDAGGIITTADNKDIDFVLANTTTDSNLDIVIATDSTSTVKITRAAGAGTANPSQLLLLDDLDADLTIADGLKITTAGVLTDAIDLSDAEIVNALNIGANNLITAATTLASTELDLLDSGITLSELTDSGTLTATTVDINGGNIDGTVIGATTRAAGSFITLDANGNTTLGDASGDTLTINAGSSGTGISFSDASFATCTALETVSGVLTCGSDDTSAGGSGTLQEAYDAGGIITTSDNKDIDFVLANTTTDSNLDIVVATDSTSTVKITRAAGTGTANPSQLLLLDDADADLTIADGLKITTAGVLTDALDLSDAEIVNALNIG
ncbi:MAG: MerR family DNA-binding transcriptional regulator, partial [Candidatus Andersenbacteria bacterium]